MSIKISVYIDTGNVWEYEVDSPASAREHADAIVKTGYRSQQESSGPLTWWPPHRISKVKISDGGESNYLDKQRAT